MEATVSGWEEPDWEGAAVAALSPSRLRRGPHARAVPFGPSVLFVLSSRSRPVYKLHATPFQALVWDALTEPRTLGSVIEAIRADLPDLRPIDVVWIVADLRRRNILIAVNETEPAGTARPRSPI